MRTFAISDVARAVDPLPKVEAREAIEALAGGAVEAFGKPSGALARAWTTRAVERDGRYVGVPVPWHPFVAAVHAAFDEHRPLVLSPDAVWLMIAQGFAIHVQVHAEALRSRIVSHEGRELLSVRRDDFVRGSPDNAWPDVFSALSEQVRERTGDLHALAIADFSTTTPTSRAATEIALLSAARPFFKYELVTMCGIPEITLLGTPDDWRRLRARTEALDDYDAKPWRRALGPVLHHFVEAAEGRIDREHWQSFYKLKSASGGPYVNGWINTLLPYVLDDHGRPATSRDVATWREGLDAHFGGGPTREGLTSGLCGVPFLWKYLGNEHRMELLGGFVGVTQDPKTLALAPEIGWAVREVHDG